MFYHSNLISNSVVSTTSSAYDANNIMKEGLKYWYKQKCDSIWWFEPSIWWLCVIFIFILITANL